MSKPHQHCLSNLSSVPLTHSFLIPVILVTSNENLNISSSTACLFVPETDKPYIIHTRSHSHLVNFAFHKLLLALISTHSALRALSPSHSHTYLLSSSTDSHSSSLQYMAPHLHLPFHLLSLKQQIIMLSPNIKFWTWPPCSI